MGGKIMAVKILEYRPFEKNTLRGFLTVQTPEGWIIRDICIHGRDQSRWLALPAKPIKKEDGSTLWVAIIKQGDRAKWNLFESETFAALDQYKHSEKGKGSEHKF
jgi:hypothetical protein